MENPAVVPDDPNGRPLFAATLQVTDASARVAVVGELDVAWTTALRDALAEAIASGAEEVHVDLAELRFCDAAGIGVLIGTHGELARTGRRLVLERVPSALRRTLRLAEADWLLD